MTPCRCDVCGTAVAGLMAWRCGCGGPISVPLPARFDPSAIARDAPGVWRYRAALGVSPDMRPVSLGEGRTPIVERVVDGLRARFKLEYLSPTGSFKDRGASVVISHLASHGATHAIEDSSGNAGHAMAAYGSRAGIRLEVLAPDDAPRPKRIAIEACGATLTTIAGGRGAVSARALELASSGTAFASHVWSPWFVCGTRTIAFEIWEQRHEDMPERIFFPVGNASLLIGAHEGFTLLRDSGLIERIPRLMGVQAEACAPLVPGRTEPPPGATATLADGIRVAAPPRARRARAAVDGSGGRFIAVGEAEIARAWARLGASGLDVEPTAAAAFAGALKWSREAEDRNPPLVALTGSGLKVPR